MREYSVSLLALWFVLDNMDAEVASFSFVTANKSEEIRGASRVSIPNLQKKLLELLEENDK